MNDAGFDSSPNWYIVQTHPRQEDRSEHNLRSLGIKTFTPKFKAKRLNEFTLKPTYLVKPLFPRYIFARFSLVALYHKVKYTRGISCLVSFNNTPCAVDEQIITLIQSRVGDDGFVVMEEKRDPDQESFNVGEEVIVEYGAFKNLSGIFVQEMNEARRVMILLKAVNFQAKAVFDRSAVKRANCAVVTA